MKFTITREQLSEGVSAAQRCRAVQDDAPRARRDLLLRLRRRRLRLSGTDLDIAVSTTVPASVDQEGAITLPARKLQELVRELPSAGILFTTQASSASRSSAVDRSSSCSGCRGKEFPAFPQFPWRLADHRPRPPEARGTRRVRRLDRREPPDPQRRPAGSSRPTRMRMVATKRTPPGQDGSAAPRGHRPAGRVDRAAEGARAVPGKPSAPTTRSRSVVPTTTSASSRATTQVFTRLIEGPYPNYEQVIPRENDKFATVEQANR